MGHRIRVYESALNGVTYLHDKPISFDPKDTERHLTNWVIAVRRWEARNKALSKVE
jgi:hypothetical protein